MRTNKLKAFLLHILSTGLAFLMILTSGNFSMVAEAASSTRASIESGEYTIRLHDDESKGMNTIFASTEEDKAEIGVDPINFENNEIWIITHRGNNYYSISPKHAPHLAINALLGRKEPGYLLTLHKYEDGDDCSLWSFHKNSDSSYTIKNKYTGLVIDLTNGDYTTGTRFINWTSNDYLRAQAFNLRKIENKTTDSSRVYLANGTYRILSYRNSVRCINVQFASTEEMTSKLVLDTYNGEKNEQFILINRGDNYYTISPVHCSNLCLNAAYANTQRGDVVTLYRYQAGDDASLWSFHKDSHNAGYYYIKNKATGLVIHINGSSVGTSCINWTQENNPRTQGFQVSKISSSTSGNVVTSEKWEAPMDNYYCTWNNKTNFSWGGELNSTRARRYHVGIDVYGTNGIVKAAASGKVVACSDSTSGANGRYIILQHTLNGKTLYSFYAHLESLNVTEGQTVNVGDKIGVAGRSGYGSDTYYGRHLHFAIMDTLWEEGNYYGYATKFSGNSVRYANVTYYNPVYVINNDKLP